jgi:hypothetical protein
MITVKCEDHYKEVQEFARKNNLFDNLTEQVARLMKMGDIELYKDFAPYSFYFVCFNNGKRTLEGGLIFHSTEADKENFSVTLSPTHGWKIHT